MAERNDYIVRRMINHDGLNYMLWARSKDLYPLIDLRQYSILWFIKQWWYNVRRRN